MRNIRSILMITTLALAPTLGMAQDGDVRTDKPLSFWGKQDSIITVPYAKVERERFVGAVSEVTGEQLMNSGRTNLNTAMAGLASGLTVMSGSSSVGSDTATWKVRGFSRGSNGSDGPLVVVDGVPGRSLSSITIEEIDKVEILKDATAKILYGSKAANGVIMITTKRGNGATKYEVRVEEGVKIATKVPQFLGAADYTRLYNQAQMNDGMTTFRYSEADLAAFASGTADSELYPDVDFYNQFLDDKTTFFRANAQISGSNDKVGYYLNAGYMNEGGLQTVGNKTRYDRLNFRSNIDFKINNIMSAFVNVAARWDITKNPGLSVSDMYDMISTHRPSDYPLTLDVDGVTELGYNNYTDGLNLLGELTKTGYTDSETSYAQSNLGLNFDLSSITQGLSAKAFLGYDYRSTLQKGKVLTYSTMRMDLIDDEKVYYRDGEDTVKGSESKISDDIERLLSTRFILGYDRTFNDVHEVSATAIWAIDNVLPKKTDDVFYQNDRGMNIDAKVNYSYDRRYVVEGTVSHLGSNKFNKDNRWGTFGAVGAGWNISNEQFMEDVSWVDFLKLKGSWGVLGYDNAYDYFIYDNFYGGSGNTFYSGIDNSNKSWGTQVTSIGNPNFTFEKSREFNVGVEGVLFNNTLAFEVNYFDEYRYDIPTNNASIYPSYMGYSDLDDNPTFNTNEVTNKGIEFEAYYRNNIGDLNYEIGANMTYTKAVNKLYNENVLYEHLAKSGLEADAIWGLRVDENNPMYTSQEEIANMAITSSFEDALIVGDLIYDDIYDDGIINSTDVTVIGNSNPRYNYAFSMNLEYKGFEFYAMGQGLAGFDKNLVNFLYFDPQGENKYSVMALQAVTPDPSGVGFVDDSATLPRLSTNSTHSYRTSSFWLERGDYFKLRTVQIAYNLPKSVVSKIGAEGLRVFVTGDNLCETSSIMDLDPENLNAGITGNPTFRTISIGLNLNY